jgi:hypothetical protein
MVKWLRFKHRIPAPPAPEHTLGVPEVGRRYGVSLGVVYYWIDRGIVAVQQRKLNTPYAITIDDEADQRLLRVPVHRDHRFRSIVITHSV